MEPPPEPPRENESQARVAGMSADIQTITTSIQSISAELTESRKRPRPTSPSSPSAPAKRQKLETDLTDCQAKFRDLTARHTALQRQWTTSQERVTELTAQVNACLKDLDDLAKKGNLPSPTNRSARITRLTTERDQANTERDQAQADLRDSQNRLKALQEDWKTSQLRITQLKNQLEDARLKDNSSGLVKDLQQQLADVDYGARDQDQIDELKEEIKRLKEEVKKRSDPDWHNSERDMTG